MKKKYAWIVTALCLVVVIAAAGFLYNKYAGEYGGGNLVEVGSHGSESAEAPHSHSSVSSISSGDEEDAQSSEFASDESTEGPTANSSQSSSVSEYAAPDFTVTDSEGKEVKLSDFRGKPVVLNFWATWCYYCKQGMPDFDDAAKKHPEVQFMLVNATDGYKETLGGAKAYIAEKGFDFDVFYDTKRDACATYGVSSLPVTYFIDANGDLVTYARGRIDAQTLERAIGVITK